MTTQKLFKRRVRERMGKTGESYTAARRHAMPGRERRESARTGPLDLSSAYELASERKVLEATGHGWEYWLDELDRWGATRRTHAATANHLISEHAVPGWYAQAITNGYERVRGLRIKHQQADGFTVYASKTVAVPVAVLFDAFVDDAQRVRWLTDGAMTLRSAQPGKVARFDWNGGPTRVMVTFDPKGPAKTTASVAHERLPDAETAEVAKALWRARVSALKSHLEASPTA